MLVPHTLGFLVYLLYGWKNAYRHGFSVCIIKGVAHDQQPAVFRNTHGDPSFLVFTMVWVIDGQSHWINKNGCSLFKADTMFLHVRVCLLGVPLEVIIYTHNKPLF
jgi:hypothetical protein